jgi:transcriptional regulator with PAS, ATPase and Fis domain
MPESQSVETTQALADRLGIVSQDVSMLRLVDRAKKFAQSEISILVTGESGTGKEVLARAIHKMSPRHRGPFGVVNVAALPESLIESSLFGAEKGSFTGATNLKNGLVESASGGTFFFDEIGDFPLQLQAKLLRLIQEKKVMRVGGTQERDVDVRFVFATHRTLSELVPQKLFREDLFYRVSEIQLHLPALRDRGDDRIFLANHFAKTVGRDVLGSALTLTPECQAFVATYDWPGNVRELYSAIKRAVILCDGTTIEPDNLQIERAKYRTDIAHEQKGESSTGNVAAPEASLSMDDGGSGGPLHWDADTLNRARIEAEIKVVLACLKEHEGNVSSVARLLNVSRPTVYNILRKAKEWVRA